MNKNLLSKFELGLFDFHTHSSESDGSYSPSELVKKAVECGVSALALTDHNVISGLKEFKVTCDNEKSILGIPFGVEIHAELPKEIISQNENDSPDLVILGKKVKIDIFKDYRSWRIKDFAERFIPETINKLEKVGFEIPKFKINEQAKMGVPRIFHSFVNYGKNMEFFVKYIKDIEITSSNKDIIKNPVKFLNRYLYSITGPAYVKRCQGFSVSDAVKLTKSMNAKIFIAHPGGGFDIMNKKVLDYYVKKGIHGIEVRNYFNTNNQNHELDNFAEKNNLLKSGGSDYHGNNSPAKLGMFDRRYNQLPKEILRKIWYGLPD